METASSWDSFKQTLIKVLGEFKPKTVMEWGPGVSTLIMQDFPSVEHIDTVEHDSAWHSKWMNKFGNKTDLIYCPDLGIYPFAGQSKEYDLYFVDGRERERCLDLISSIPLGDPSSIVILHDAERESYQLHIKKFAHIFMEDGGHTAVMTNNDEYAKRLENVFENCHTSS